jgi:hypothetical protein
MIITEEKKRGMMELIRKDEMIVVDCGRRLMIVIMPSRRMTAGDKEKGRIDRGPSMKMH